jgi:hypothetical protein
MGRLPLTGPAKTSATRKVLAAIAKDKSNYSRFKNIADMKVAKGKIVVTVKNK